MFFETSRKFRLTFVSVLVSGHTFFIGSGLCHSPSGVKRDGRGNHTQAKEKSPDPFDVVDVGFDAGLERFEQYEERDAGSDVSETHGSKNRQGQNRSGTKGRAFGGERG